ncbi:CU044_5270 family protein [Nonomuraea sp. NPDC049480]|uniref:CU044_5270 family protein n=1 Tax=Nonomuraea sp. NPDC049480 TaxID=3364353 RepID=UPI00378F53F2
MTDRRFAELKPAALDELTEEAYHRRRSADLARAFTTPRAPGRRSRRPFLLMAGTMAAGLAAAAATVIVVSGGESGESRKSTPPVAAQPGTARSFLLAAASTAMREPAASGRYWYVRERVVLKMDEVPSEYMARLKPLMDAYAQKEKELKGDPERLDAERKEFERKVAELKKQQQLPYLVYRALTYESWRTLKQGEPGRTVTHDGGVSFGSPEDEAAWKAAGSPELLNKLTRTRVDDEERMLSVDNPSLTLQNLSELPTTEDALKRELDALQKRRPHASRIDRSIYLWQTGVDLMTAPLQPATRSALFKVLAEQPGITSDGQAKDVLGRTGVALSASTADALTMRLIIDGETAELLQYEIVEKGLPTLRVALEQLGWSDTLGKRPKS